MKILSLVLALCLITSFVFADYLIIDKQTRIILRITSLDPPEYDKINEEAIKVPNKTDIGGGLKKLAADNKTFVAVTEQDKTNLIYRLYPGIKKRIDLTASIDAYNTSPTAQGLKDILLKLKDLYEVKELPILE